MNLIRPVLCLSVLLLSLPVQAADLPAELETTITQMTALSNQGDLDGYMRFFDPGFRHEDGLTRAQMRQALEKLWANHEQLTYTTTIQSWEHSGSRATVTLSTRVTGQERSPRGVWRLNGETVVENRYLLNAEGMWHLLGQRTLRESITLRSGQRPPTVTVNLPTEVPAGENFTIEAIVAEPLQDRLLAGSLVSQQVMPSLYGRTTSFRLAPLQAGGIFRTATAPETPGSQWISVMFVNSNGVTIASQRLQILAPPSSGASQ